MSVRGACAGCSWSNGLALSPNSTNLGGLCIDEGAGVSLSSQVDTKRRVGGPVWRRETPVKKTRLIAAALAACALAVALVGCGGSDTQDAASRATSGTSGAAAAPGASGGEEAVVVGTLATEDILPMWVAEAEDLDASWGLDVQVEVFQSATELIAAVSAGQVDFAMTDPMVSASLYASGSDVRVEWVTLGLTAAQGRFGIMTADPAVTSLTDLAGESIGVGSNTILEYVMDTLMEQAGVPADQVVKEELQKLPVRYEAMASGQVKAAALPASLLALGEASGYVVVADDTQGANISQSVMIVRSEYLADHVEVASALQAVWDEAVAEINADPESYRALLVEKASLSSEIAESYPISEYPAAELPSAEMIEPVLVWMQDKGYLEAGIGYDAATGCFTRE